VNIPAKFEVRIGDSPKILGRRGSGAVPSEKFCILGMHQSIDNGNWNVYVR